MEIDPQAFMEISVFAAFPSARGPTSQQTGSSLVPVKQRSLQGFMGYYLCDHWDGAVGETQAQ